jgi:hypothetical protein
LRALPEKFDELENWLLRDRALLAQGTGVPFIRLAYRPDEEIECARRRDLLRRTLEGKGVEVQTVSCRDVIFAYFVRVGWLDQLFEYEQTNERQLSERIAVHASEELTGRILSAAKGLTRDGVLFLVDVAFLYPYLPLGPVLDNCTNCIQPPAALAIFYPGEFDSQKGLLFLGARPTNFYRTRDLI